LLKYHIQYRSTLFTVALLLLVYIHVAYIIRNVFVLVLAVHFSKYMSRFCSKEMTVMLRMKHYGNHLLHGIHLISSMS